MPRFENGKPVWWLPSEIKFKYDQVIFILDHLNTFRDGRYPSDPAKTGYDNAGWKASVNPRAAFITPAEIVAELDRRLLRCGMDWYLVNDYYENGLKLEEIAANHFLEEDDVWNRIQRVIHYAASGPVPRWVTTEKRNGLEYQAWCDQNWRPQRKFTENRKHRIRVYRA